MKIDNNTIKYIADLSMIKIDETEEEKFAKSLEQILTYSEILDKLDLDGVSDENEFIREFNKFRPDDIIASMSVDELMKNAPSTEINMFKIPKTF